MVLDLNDDVELEEGDMLVCRITDPSWAPVFALVEALVIDIGGTASGNSSSSSLAFASLLVASRRWVRECDCGA